MKYIQNLLALCAFVTFFLANMGCFPAMPQIGDAGHPSPVKEHCVPNRWMMEQDQFHTLSFRQCNDAGDAYGDAVGFSYTAMPATGNESLSVPKDCVADTWYNIPCQGRDGRNYGFVQCGPDGRGILDNGIVICGFLTEPHRGI